jgi:predicted DNA-binding transcriptional regulator AlpA
VSGGTLLDRGGSIMSVKFPLPLPFLRTQEAARFIGLSYRTLEKYRMSGTGPKYMKIGGRIVYAVKDLREWAERSARRATSDPGRTTIPPAKPVDKASRIRPVGDGSTGAKRNTAGQPARLDTPAAARFIGVSCRTLEKHRVYGTGPSYSRLSGRVFYTIGDLTEWAKRGAKHSTSDKGKTTVLGAIPANRRAIKLEGGVR